MGWKESGNQINISENSGFKVVWDIDFVIYEIKGTNIQIMPADKLYDEKIKMMSGMFRNQI